MDVIGGAGLENALLSRITMSIMPPERVLRGAGRALRYRLVGRGFGEVVKGRVRGCEGVFHFLIKNNSLGKRASFI